MKDKAGDLIRLGQYWDKKGRKWVAVPGVPYKGILCTSTAFVDWDADGDLDILMGTQDGPFYLCMNEGTPSKAAYSTKRIPVQVNDKPMKVPCSTPYVVDWDGDGLWDIITGSRGGSISWFKNIGAKGNPVFSSNQVLLTGSQGPWSRTTVSVVDYDADGDLDILFGDMAGWVWFVERK